MTETILLVEDDESLRRLAQRLLAKMGYSVIPAGDGAAAVAGCRDSPTDIQLLITDVFMPDIGGPELAQHLLAIRPSMKVLYVSGNEQAIQPGGPLAKSSHFLLKPYSQDQLKWKIREILDS
jgi:two-component system cell cycle sensor histidine kinase/response regulator CckA